MNNNRNFSGKVGTFVKTSRVTLGRRSLLAGSFFAGLAAAIPAYAQQKPQSQISQTTTQENVNKELAGKVAIVTGARANLGRGFAVELAKHGADIVVHYHREETRSEAEETARLVQEQGVRAALISGDLGQPATVKQMFDAAFNNFGRADILVNNAGAIIKKPIAEVSDEELERMININTRGTFLCMREGARRLSDNGRIINIATSLLAASAPNYAAYAGSKAIVEELTRMGSKELGKRGITVNSISPGPVDTPFFHSMETPETTKFAASLSNAGRLGAIDDIVPLVVFLAMPNAQWISGQTIWINGGYLTR
ncbi:SDR family oxidoreductase [Candidatus Gracilibacteria bacterium]|nr:SDR family oxidoreductase [Candidatus Gracilibacteria bacterium]NJP22494.1 SDR family oxidoreductase [Hydrococcus sp. CRU_1_1]